MLARFFKPKWQHHKADIRLRAISKLDADSPESNAILTQLALQDEDASVRRAALERSLDAELLVRASEQDNDPHNRTVALKRITHLISGESGNLDTDARLRLLPAVRNPELLFHLALRANQHSVQQQALQQLDEQALLLELIQQSDSAPLKLQAAQRLQAPSLLEQLEKYSRGKDKRLFRIARDKLAVHKSEQAEALARQQRRSELFSSLQHLNNTGAFPQFGAKLDALNIEWQRFNRDASEAERQQWLKLTEACQLRRYEIDQQQQATEAEQARQTEQQAQLDQLQQQLNQSEITPEQLQALSESWQQQKSAASKTQHTRIEQRIALLQQRHSAEQQLETQQSQLQKLQALDTDAISHTDSKQLRQWQKQLKKLIDQINWPADVQQPDALAALAKVDKRLSEQLQNRKQQRSERSSELDSQLTQLEQLIEAGAARDAERQVQLLQKSTAELTPQQAQRFQQAQANVQELRDWQGYALTPKREALCEQMEALIDSEQAIEALAAEIKQLQQQWRELDHSGSVHSRELWKRFKKASDLAYQPCNRYYAEQREMRQQNLQRREQMCDQLDAFLAQADWDNIDWRAVEEISRTAKNEWRQYSPVDRAPGKTLQTRFNKQVNTLESQLKNHRKAVQQVKESLLEEAEALLDLDDLQEATQQAKHLQQRWKAAGTTFRAQERELWAAFRRCCNTLFGRRDERQKQARQQQRQDQSQLKQLCDALEQLHQRVLQNEAVTDELDALNAQYQTLVRQESQLHSGQQKQFEQQSALIRARLNHIAQMFGDSYHNLKQFDALCQQLENSLLEGSICDPAAIAAQWQQIPSLPAPWHEAITQRYQQALTLIGQPETEITDQSEVLRQLCIRLEIAVGEPSPLEDEALRLEYQMQRLQQALKQQQEGFDLQDVQQLAFERRCLPFYQCHDALNQRFEQLLAGYNLS